MTYEELRADALALCADLSATADDGADLDPDSLKERRASEALSVLSGMPPAGGHVRPAADLESRLESLYHAAIAEAETRRGMVAGGAAVVTDADMAATPTRPRTTRCPSPTPRTPHGPR